MTDNTPTEGPEEPAYGLVMPFVTVASKGGPHEDRAYCAGWEMGKLDALLEHARPPVHGQPVLAVSEPQADLLAMKHGYRAEFSTPDEEVDPEGTWRWMVVTRGSEVSHG